LRLKSAYMVGHMVDHFELLSFFKNQSRNRGFVPCLI